MRTSLRGVLLVLLLTAACGDGSGSSSVGSGSSTPPPSGDSEFSLWLSAARVPPEAVDLAAVLVNRTGTQATFGVAAEVDRWDGERWESYGRIAMCLDHWHCTAKIRQTDEGLEVQDIGLMASMDRPGPVQRFTTEGLSVGWWRISQRANEGVMARGVLEVAEGAPRPAPLAPNDAPSISVAPAVMPTGEREVTLFPLVPAEDGTQSLSDVEEAVAGLAGTATVERWQDGRWTHVVDVTLAVAPEGSGLERTAQLPPLEQGEYRIARTGSDQPHTGRFWVSDHLS